MKAAARVIVMVLVGVNASFSAPSTLISSRAIERGRNSKVVESVRQSAGSVGQATLVTNLYTVLEDGMHRWDSNANQWVESHPVFESYPDAIVGTGAGHSVILNTNLNTIGAVDFESSDGSRIVSVPIAILYFDPESGRSVTVGTIKDSTGEIFSSNSVIYTDCFEGQVGKVALIYTYDKGSFRQDVSFLERPPDPAAFGLGEKSRMEVITEIVQSPEFSITEHVWSAETNAVKRAAMAEPDVVDETISFGAARMTLGWAFSDGQLRQLGVPVAKRLMEIDGRRVLVESLEWQAVSKSLEKLFPHSASASGKTRQAAIERKLPGKHIAQAGLQSFETRLAQVTQSGPEARKYVSIGDSTQRGFVVDYTVLDSYLEDFTFASGQTYVVDGYVFVDSPTFERGATIKAEQGANLTVSGSIQGPSGSVGKVVFTAVDDNSVGSTISGSTGNPSGTYAEYALASYYVSSYPYWHDLDIRYAETGFYIYGGDHSISSSFFYKCDVGVCAESSTVSVSSSDFCEVGTWCVGEVDTSSLTECQADRDSDSLPDNWEFEYFGNLSQTATGDYDGDGLTNLQEYQGGTNPTVPNLIATPVLSPSGGIFTTKRDVTITCATSGATIHYTLNGSDPTESDAAITSGENVTVIHTGTLKAKAFKTGRLPSTVETASFTITGAIAAGRKHTLGLKSDGTVLAAGSNGNGQGGDGTTHLRTSLGAVAALPSDVVGVAAGQLFSMAWTTSGEAWMWGGNENGQLGNGQTGHHQTTPIQIPNLSDIISMSGGNQHTLALKPDGSVWAWGLNYNYQLGDGTDTRRLSPVQVRLSPSQYLSGIVAVAAGGTHSLALGSDGKVWAWGHGTSGQLGNGGNQNQAYPVRVKDSSNNDLSNVKAIAAGMYFNLALKNDDTVWAWGSNTRGQLGDGTTTSRFKAVQVQGLSGVVMIAIAAGGTNCLALKSDGTVWAWGDNRSGQLGDCGTEGYSVTPVEVDGLSDVIAIAANRGHGVALKSDGTIATWGWLNYGEEVNHDSCATTPDPDVHLLDWDDADGDALPTWLERELSTDPDNPDTGNTGTSDAYKDADSDGLLNIEEFKLGSDPLQPNVASPIFDPVGEGDNSSPLDVKVTCPTPGASIYYSIDESEPTLLTGDEVILEDDYNVSSLFNATRTLTAYATKTGWTSSDTEAQGYNFGGGHQPPTVTLSPSGGQFFASDTIDLVIEADDTDGTIYKVQLYRGDGEGDDFKVAESATSSLHYTLDNLPAGSYTYTAKAIDDSGAVTLSTATFTIDGSGPVVSLVGSQPFFTSSPGTLVATITGVNPGGLSSLTLNGTPVTPKTGEFTLDAALTEGENTFTLEATDGQSHTGDATTKVYLDSVAPVVSITAPDDDSTFGTERVNVTGTFTESSLKQITVNGVPAFIGSGTFEALNVPLVEGANTITATAEDIAGNQASASISVTGSSTPVDPVQLAATPVGGFPTLQVTFTPTASVPGTLQYVYYDFNGDNIADQTETDLDPITHNYTTAGEYFPVVTVQTTEGRFSSLGGWNAWNPDRLRINVQASPVQDSTISVTDPIDLKTTANGHLFVLSRSTATITEYDTSASVVRSKSSIGTTPTGMDVDADGNVYVALSGDDQVAKFNPATTSFELDAAFGDSGVIGSYGTDDGKFNTPYDVAVSPDGTEIAVSDSGNHRIQRFATADGAFIESFGAQGSGDGEFDTPKGLAYDNVGYLYIVDSGNNRVVLTLSSTVVGASGTSGGALGQFSGAVNLCIGGRGIYVADSGNDRVQAFDPIQTGEGASPTPLNARLALSSQFSTSLSHPSAVAPIADFLAEKIYIADTDNDRILKMTLPESSSPGDAWDAMKTELVSNNDIEAAISYFSSASAEDYRRSFISIGETALDSVMNKTLTPAAIENDAAQYYFEDEDIVPGQTITFPVEFVKENGVWKILGF